MDNQNGNQLLNTVREEIEYVNNIYQNELTLSSLSLLKNTEKLPEPKIEYNPSLKIDLDHERIERFNLTAPYVDAYIKAELKKEEYDENDIDTLQNLTISKDGSYIRLLDIAVISLDLEPNYIIEEYIRSNHPSASDN